MRQMNLSPDFKDSDNYWFSKGVTVVGFIVNNAILKEKGLEAPKTWMIHKGRVSGRGTDV